MLKPNLNSSKTYKVFLFGLKSTGKTTILERLIFGSRSAANLTNVTKFFIQSFKIFKDFKYS